MAGPGGIEEGRVSIRVVPDVSGFAAELRAELERIQRSAKVDIPVSLDTSGIVEHARAATAEAQAAAGKVQIKTSVDRVSLSTASRALTRFTSGLGAGLSSILRATAFSAIGVTASAAVPKILTLAASLSQVIGVAGLLPAVFATAAGALLTLGIGLHGFDAALTALGKGNTQKFNAALKNLAPNARAAALEIKSLVPQFKDLRNSVQQHLFAGLNTDIKQTAHVLLPILKSGLSGIADGLNLITHNSAVAVQGLAKTGAIGGTFKNIKASLELLAPAVSDLLTAFGRISAIGSSFLPKLAGQIQNAATAFRDFIDTPKGANAVQQFIQSGITAFGQLFDVLKSVTSVLGGLLRAAQTAGGGTLATFAKLLQGVADVVNSPAFQQGLVTVFVGLQAGASALAGALPAVGQALEALAPLIATFATSIGQTLAAAIQALAPSIVILAPALNQLLVALAPQIVAGINALAPALAQVATFLAANKPLLAAVAAGILAIYAPVTLVIGALLLLAANFGTIKTFFQNQIVPVFQQVVTFLQPTIAAFQSLGSSIVTMFQVVAPIFAQLFAIVQQNFPQIRTIIVQVFSTIQSIVVLAMTGITFQIKVATTIISFIWAHFGTTILGIVRAVFPAILAVISGVLNVIQGIIRFFTALYKGDWSGAWNAIKQITSGAVATLQALLREGLAVLAGIAKLAISAFVQAFAFLGSKILHAVGDIGSMFVGLGEEIVQGIARGVTRAASAVAGAVTGAASSALSKAKSFLKINSPSKLFAAELGSPIAEGIAFGVTKSAGLISGAVIQAVTPPDLPGGFDSSIGGGGGSGARLIFTGPVGVDPHEVIKTADTRWRDTASVFGLAAVGAGI